MRKKFEIIYSIKKIKIVELEIPEKCIDEIKNLRVCERNIQRFEDDCFSEIIEENKLTLNQQLELNINQDNIYSYTKPPYITIDSINFLEKGVKYFD